MLFWIIISIPIIIVAKIYNYYKIFICPKCKKRKAGYILNNSHLVCSNCKYIEDQRKKK